MASPGTSSSHAALVKAALESARAKGPLSEHIGAMKTILYSDGAAAAAARPGDSLTKAVLATDLLVELIVNLPDLEFECRKDVTMVFSNLLRRQSAEKEMLTVSWLSKRPEVLDRLLRGGENPRVALNYGAMFRECCRHEALVAQLLSPPHCRQTYVLFGFIESPFFDVASDAFASLRELLTKHRAVAARFLEAQYDDFFAQYHLLLRSENYVTKRQSLKLLSDLLLDRSNFATMTKYITSTDHLKTIMNLLRDGSATIQMEAFHVFKIYVANPNKGAAVHDLLLRNKERLQAFLAAFQNDRADEQFAEEKRFVMDEIARLEPR